MKARDIAAIAGIGCPVCHVPPGEHCRSRPGEVRQSPIHSPRREAWQALSRWRLKPRPAPPPEDASDR